MGIGTYAYSVIIAIAVTIAIAGTVVAICAVAVTDVSANVGVDALAVCLICGLLSYLVVRRVYTTIVGRVSGNFIVYTDAKGAQFFISVVSAPDITATIKQAPNLKIIASGEHGSFNIISGKLEDLPFSKKGMYSEEIAKGDNLAVKWQAIKEAIAGLAKESSKSDEAKHDNTFAVEALEAAGFPVFCQPSKTYSELETIHFKIALFIMTKIRQIIIFLSIFLSVILLSITPSFFLGIAFLNSFPDGMFEW